jgi:hypothetical protein
VAATTKATASVAAAAKATAAVAAAAAAATSERHRWGNQANRRGCQ